jgi:hypothetical protein
MLRQSSALEAAVVFAVAVCFAWVLMSANPGQLDPDSWYHFLISQQIAQGQAWVDITWLPYTVLGEKGPDHHWLWHVLMAPLTLLGEPQFAIKFTGAVTFALVPLGITVFLQRAGVQFAGLWAMLAVVAALVVPGRLMMLRAQNLALILLLASIAAMHMRRPVACFLLGFCFMASYHGALILAPLGLIYMSACFLAKRELPWQGPAWLGAGVAAGLLLTPWPGQNISYLLFHTLYKTDISLPGMAGTEWLQLSPLTVLTQAWPAHLALLAALVGSRKEWTKDPLCLLLMGSTFMFLLMFFNSWRFVEYYAPLAVVTASVVWSRYGRMHRPIALTVVLLLLVSLNGWLAGVAIVRADRYAVADYREVNEYLLQHAVAGEIVVNSHWPDFPMLLWPEGRYRFAAGLDGSYLAFADQRRFTLWWQLAAENFPSEKDLALLVQAEFSSRWLAVNRGHGLLLERLEASPHARKAAESRALVLFEITP